ncbi:sulfurtransferase [Virgisporangium aliadipatigenens]|uniref:Sulfurtransferase n=1 Tax=Virgisporangium aliadipatigenens TaxID=741659 RepID=A0A8J4DVI0_9ACTN|nr:sulfurtransferase [Virgisporangium aliadipatigenens]
MTVPAVGPAQVPQDAFLLDVREPDEWAAGRAPGAVHVPMMQIPQRTAEIPTDREVVVVCRVGGRSGQVVHYLRQQGFDNVVNLDGGMYAWAAAGRPVVDGDGGAGTVI